MGVQYISLSRCGLAALAFLGLFPCGTQVLGFVGFFYFDSNPQSAHSSSRTGTRITEVFTRRSHLIMFPPQNSDAATRLNLLSTHFVALAALKQALNLIIKGSESGVLISGCATKEVKLRQEQICMYYM